MATIYHDKNLPSSGFLLADLAVRYPQTEGFSIEIYQAYESRRILETSHSGLKTLAVEYEMTAVERE